MKVIYLSNLLFTDCDFPLIREMQHRGIDVYYFITIYPYAHRCALLDLKNIYGKNGIYKAKDVYPEFMLYENYLNLDKVYVVNYTSNAGLKPENIFLTYKMVRKFMKINPDIVNLTWPVQSTRSLLYLMRKKLVLTLHDPFPHSGKARAKEFEMWRKISFKMINKIIILNDTHIQLFCDKYKYPRNHVYSAKLGLYDCINNITPDPLDLGKKYILFFGLISRYKGVEYLIEAFNKIHEKYNDIQLVIAGKGELYFDKELYKGKEYITILNEYISMPRLAGLLKDALFTVCPYKDATQSGVIQTAFSMDCPVVATNVGALPEAIDNQITGLIVPPCDSDALADAMDKLLGDASLLKSMRAHINKIWRKQMGWGKILDQYIKCYKAK